MQELMTNKYGQTIPLPKIYQDEDSSDSEGLTLEDGTRVGKKATSGTGGSGGGRPGRKPSTGGSGGRVAAVAPAQVVALVSVQVAAVA